MAKRIQAAFSGGDKLKAALTQMSARVNNPGTLSVGFLEGATYPSKGRKDTRAAYAKRKRTGNTDAIKGSKGGVSVPMVAAIQEFGAPKAGIPPRPFMRRTIKSQSAAWARKLGKLLVANNYDAKKTLRLMGEVISGDLRATISTLSAPPLKEATVEAKGFDKPLIDTGHLLASVDYKVN